MPVARARSRLVKLILPIASTIGRASNWVMSICSTMLDRSSALRVSLALVWSMPGSIRDSVVIPLLQCTACSCAGRSPVSASCLTGFLPSQEHSMLPLHGSRTLALRGGSIERSHGLVVDDFGAIDAKAVEGGAHRAAVGAKHPNFDIIAGSDIAGKRERTGHMVKIVAGRAVKAEFHRPDLRGRVAQQPHRITPADVRGVEQRPIGAVIDVQLRSAALLDPHDQAAVFGAQRPAWLAPQFGGVADRQSLEGV